MDLMKGIEVLQYNKTFKYILAMLLHMGNFLNGAQVHTHSYTRTLHTLYIYLLSGAAAWMNDFHDCKTRQQQV